MTDQTLTTRRSLSEFTAQLASAQPAPGGGGAAALAGALAASLAAMAANVTAANPRYADRHDALATLAASCDAQRTTLLALIEADAAGFLPLQKAYEMVLSGEIKDGKTIAGVLKLKALLDEGKL